MDLFDQDPPRVFWWGGLKCVFPARPIDSSYTLSGPPPQALVAGWRHMLISSGVTGVREWVGGLVPGIIQTPPFRLTFTPPRKKQNTFTFF